MSNVDASAHCEMTPVRKIKISAEERDNVKNYMILEFSYSVCVCVPYEDGLKILEGLQRAERVSSFYGHEGIKFSKDPLEVKTTTVPQRDYRGKKMEFLLGLHDEEPK